MNTIDFIRERVARYYWKEDINCARTVLNILSERFDIEINEQLHHAATGMFGAGGHGSQCGLVEGTLLFIGVFGHAHRLSEEQIIIACKAYAEQFESTFTSLECRALRPEGFTPDNPPHICESLTRETVLNSIEFIESLTAVETR